MNTEKITSEELYTVEASKENGDTLNAEEWNKLSDAAKVSHEKINSLADDLSSVTADVVAVENSLTNISNTVNKTSRLISGAASGNTNISSTNDIVLNADSVILNTDNVTMNTRSTNSTITLPAQANNIFGYSTQTSNMIRSANFWAKIRYGYKLESYAFAPGDFWDDSIDDNSLRHVIIVQMNDVSEQNILPTSLGDLFDVLEMGPVAGEYIYGDLAYDFSNNEFTQDVHLQFGGLGEVKRWLYAEDNIQEFYLIVVEGVYFQNNGTPAWQQVEQSSTAPTDLYDNCFRVTSSNNNKSRTIIDSDFQRLLAYNKTVSFTDIVTLVDYFKSNNQGPWAN